MGKFEEKMVETFSWSAKVSMVILLFVVMVHSCSDSMVQLKQDTGVCQCGCSCVTDTSSCKQCDEKIRTIVKEELDKQMTEAFD